MDDYLDILIANLKVLGVPTAVGWPSGVVSVCDTSVHASSSSVSGTVNQK
jgi:hypothetical protein